MLRLRELLLQSGLAARLIAVLCMAIGSSTLTLSAANWTNLQGWVPAGSLVPVIQQCNAPQCTNMSWTVALVRIEDLQPNDMLFTIVGFQNTNTGMNITAWGGWPTPMYQCAGYFGSDIYRATVVQLATQQVWTSFHFSGTAYGGTLIVSDNSMLGIAMSSSQNKMRFYDYWHIPGSAAGMIFAGAMQYGWSTTNLCDGTEWSNPPIYVVGGYPDSQAGNGSYPISAPMETDMWPSATFYSIYLTMPDKPLWASAIKSFCGGAGTYTIRIAIPIMGQDGTVALGGPYGSELLYYSGLTVGMATVTNVVLN